jgi:hypothetical protein
MVPTPGGLADPAIFCGVRARAGENFNCSNFKQQDPW